MIDIIKSYFPVDRTKIEQSINMPGQKTNFSMCNNSTFWIKCWVIVLCRIITWKDII